MKRATRMFGINESVEIQTAGYITTDGELIYLQEYHGEDPELQKMGYAEFSSTHLEEDTCVRLYKEPTQKQYEQLEMIIDTYLDAIGYCKAEIYDTESGKYTFYKVFSLYEGACAYTSFDEIVGNWTGYKIVQQIKAYYRQNKSSDLTEKENKTGKGDIEMKKILKEGTANWKMGDVGPTYAGIMEDELDYSYDDQDDFESALVKAAQEEGFNSALYDVEELKEDIDQANEDFKSELSKMINQYDGESGDNAEDDLLYDAGTLPQIKLEGGYYQGFTVFIEADLKYWVTEDAEINAKAQELLNTYLVGKLNEIGKAYDLIKIMRVGAFSNGETIYQRTEASKRVNESKSISQLTEEQLKKLRSEIVLDSLYLNDYSNTLGIDEEDAYNFFNGFVSYMLEVARDEGVEDDEIFDVYDEEENLIYYWEYIYLKDLKESFHDGKVLKSEQDGRRYVEIYEDENIYGEPIYLVGVYGIPNNELIQVREFYRPAELGAAEKHFERLVKSNIRKNKEESLITERKWEYVEPLGKELRDYIEQEDYENVLKTIYNIAKKYEEKLGDDGYEFEELAHLVENEWELVDDYERLSEIDFDSPEDLVDERLEMLYDACDSNGIFLSL